MPHFTPDYKYRFQQGWTCNTPDVQRFIPAGASFDDALTVAGRVNGASVDGGQPVAIMQADTGQFFLAPLGYYSEGGSFHHSGWTEPGDIRGTVQRGGQWSLEDSGAAGVAPSQVPGNRYDSYLATGQLASIAPLHQAVKAVVDRNGCYDLRDGAAIIGAATGANDIAAA